MSNPIPGDDAERIHELKTDPAVFDAVARGDKTHEIRLNDRGFAVGDTLLLRETESTGSAMRSAPKLYPLVYTGRTATRIVSHIQIGYGLADGWCILSFAAPVSADVAADPVDCPKCVGSSITGEVRGIRCSNCSGRGYIAAGAPAETVKAAPGLLQQFLDAAAADGITALPKLMAIYATPSPSAEVARDAARLEWSAEMNPNSECGYNHVTAQTPFGRILITWKGWKDYPSPTVDEHPVEGYFYVGHDVKDAKENAESAYFAAMKLQATAKEGL